MFVDGNAIASRVNQSTAAHIAKRRVTPTLGIVIVGEDPVIERFVRRKKKVAESIGIVVREFRYAGDIANAALISKINTIAISPEVHGLIIQLPLPPHVDVQQILNAVPVEKDVDVLSQKSVAEFRRGTSRILPPVAAAIQEILETHHVSVAGKDALVVGHGRLVGVPAALLLRHNDAHVTVIAAPVSDLATHTKEADIIVSGVGKSGLITRSMVKNGVILLDAGTSEEGGVLRGDISPECNEIASLFTPVPGGIGPVTVAMLLKNLCIMEAALT